LIALLLFTKEILGSIGTVEVNHADKEFCNLLFTSSQKMHQSPIKWVPGLFTGCNSGRDVGLKKLPSSAEVKKE